MVAFLPNHLQCVVALTKSTEDVQSIGTGFLYAFPRSGKLEEFTNEYNCWLVTCKHIIEGIRSGDGVDEIVAWMNLADQQNIIKFRIQFQIKKGGTEWYLHPTKDIAVIRASWQDFEEKNVQWELFAAGRNAVTRMGAAIQGLGEGDTIFILGFPRGWKKVWQEDRQNYPVVRHGILAQTQGWLNGEHETFLVDGSGFSGNSGGPVIAPMPQFGVLIGMVSEVRLSPISEGLNETADLIEVIPVESINETIELAIKLESDNT